jgi:hypothetical protein
LLSAGIYILRSGAASLEDDSSLLPIYHKYGTALETAEPSYVYLGETQPDIAIRPVKGRLLELSGMLTGPGDRPVRLTLITDTGRRQIASLSPPSTSIAFTASGVPPGALLAEGSECGGYYRVIAERDTTGLRVACGPLTRSVIEWRVADSPRANIVYPVLMRRVDLDGTGPAGVLKPEEPPLPGHWEIMVQTGDEHYALSIRSQFGGPPATRNDGWFGLDFGNRARLQILLSSKPSSVSGVVSSRGSALAGAAVYLELFDPDLPNQRLQLWSGRSDAQGNYRFAGLMPGTYRLLSSFDFDTDDRLAMEEASVVVLHESDAATQPLEMALP